MISLSTSKQKVIGYYKQEVENYDSICINMYYINRHSSSFFWRNMFKCSAFVGEVRHA